MKFIVLLLLVGSLSAEGYIYNKQDQALLATFDIKSETKMTSKVETKASFGSMVKPYKTITLDIYQETDVNVEQQQIIIARLLAQLKALQEAKVTVNPKFKVIVR